MEQNGQKPELFGDQPENQLVQEMCHASDYDDFYIVSVEDARERWYAKEEKALAWVARSSWCIKVEYFNHKNPKHGPFIL